MHDGRERPRCTMGKWMYTAGLEGMVLQPCMAEAQTLPAASPVHEMAFCLAVIILIVTCCNKYPQITFLFSTGGREKKENKNSVG